MTHDRPLSSRLHRAVKASQDPRTSNSRQWMIHGLCIHLQYVYLQKYVDIMCIVIACIKTGIYAYIYIHTYTELCIYLYIYTYTELYIYMYIYTPLLTCINKHRNIQRPIYIYIYLYVYIYIYLFMYVDTCVQAYIYICICRHVQLYIYIYAYIYIFIYIQIHVYIYTYA